jgi:hypothetical protein
MHCPMHFGIGAMILDPSVERVRVCFFPRLWQSVNTFGAREIALARPIRYVGRQYIVCNPDCTVTTTQATPY